jgi:hypothetical protein
LYFPFSILSVAEAINFSASDTTGLAGLAGLAAIVWFGWSTLLAKAEPIWEVIAILVLTITAKIVE